MLFHSSLRKELSRSFGATLVVFVTIVMTMMLIRTLGLASRGSVNPSEVILVMSYTALGYMPTILSLSLFVAIVGVLSRIYRDSEMAIWFTSGQGLTTFLRPLLQFSWPILLLIGFLALVGWPWANSQTQLMRTHYEQRNDIDRVAPGEFQESAGRNRVFFIDKNSADKSVASNVFIFSAERNLEIVTSAQTGRIEPLEDGRYLMLRNGQRLERTLDHTGLRISEFETYGARIDDAAATSATNQKPRNQSTMTLLRQPTLPNLGELGWRIGLLLAAANFVLLGVTISNVNPRAGRSGNLILALFIFVIYYNLLNLGENWVASGRLQLGAFLLALHGGVLVVGLLWLAKRHNNWVWPRLLKRRAGQAAH